MRPYVQSAVRKHVLAADEVIEHAATIGLDGACITDHDTMEVCRCLQGGFQEDGLCEIVESMNGRNTVLENQQVEGWTSRYALSQCGGSDAHALEELGNSLTRFSVPVRSRNDLIKALNSGLCRPELPGD